VLLAFLLVQVYAFFVKTRDAAGEEAGKVGVEFDVAGYFPNGWSSVEPSDMRLVEGVVSVCGRYVDVLATT
jgi:hypothetical protein